MNVRDNAFKKAKNFKDPRDWEIAKNTIKQLNRSILKAKRDYMTYIISRYKNDHKKFEKNLKNTYPLQGIVTTLSVCYGALNLLVLVDTSSFVPYVCDQAIAGEYEGPESTIPSSVISGGSVAAERSYLTWRTLAPVVPVWIRLTLGPNTCFISFHLSFHEPKRLWVYCPKHGLL